MKSTWSPFLGQVRIVSLFRALGQGRALSQDLSFAMSQKDWAEIQWTKPQAILAYTIANLIWTIHEKVGFSAMFLQSLVADPRTLGSINASLGGSDLIQDADALGRLSSQLNLPNTMSSLRNLINAMEVNVLPSFGVEARGMRPLLKGATLDCVRTGNVASSGKASEILDFGNLCETSISEDLEKLSEAMRGMPAKFVPQADVVERTLANIVLGALVEGKSDSPKADVIVKAVNSVFQDAAFGKMLETIKGVDATKAKAIADGVTAAVKIWKAGVNWLKWSMIGAGALVAAGAISIISGFWDHKSPSNPEKAGV